MIEELRRQFQNCKICENERHVVKSGKKVRCVCYNTAHFITYFEQANGNEEYVDTSLSEEIIRLFDNSKTAAIVCTNSNKRVKYAHTAIYTGARGLLQTKMYSDQDVSDTVFNQAQVQKWSSSWDRFINPGLLILKLCTIRNEQFVSAQTMHSIIYPREDQKKWTLLLLSSFNCIMEKYGDREMEDYVHDLLKKKGALLVDQG